MLVVTATGCPVLSALFQAPAAQKVAELCGFADCGGLQTCCELREYTHIGVADF